MQTMNREKIKQHKGKMAIIDNSMLTDLKEINSKFNKNLFPTLKSIFSQLLIVSDDTYSYNARNSEGKCVFYEELVIR